MKKRGLTIFSAILFAACLLFVSCAEKELEKDGSDTTTEGTEMSQTGTTYQQETDSSENTADLQATEMPTNSTTQEATVAPTGQGDSSEAGESSVEEPTEETTDTPDLGTGGLPII